MTNIPFFAHNVSTLGTSSTRYSPVGMGQAAAETFEANAQVKWRTAGTFSNYYVNIFTNGITASSPFTFRVNTAAGNQTVSIGSGVTGDITDTTHSDTVAAGDLVAMQYVGGGTGTNLNYLVQGFQFAPSTAGNTVNKPNVGLNISYSPNRTTFHPLGGSGINSALTESKAQFRNKTAATLQNMVANVNTNSLALGTTNSRTRINGANGNLLIGVGFGTTGKFEDTTHSDTLASGDLINFTLVVQATSGSYTAEVLACDYLTTSGATHFIGGEGTTGISMQVSAIRYYPIGVGTYAGTATESQAQGAAGVGFTASNLEINVGTWTIGTIPVTLRINAADGNQTVSATATGIFEDTTHSDTIVSTDKLNWKIAAGSGLNITAIGLLATFSGAAPARVPDFMSFFM